MTRYYCGPVFLPPVQPVPCPIYYRVARIPTELVGSIRMPRRPATTYEIPTVDSAKKQIHRRGAVRELTEYPVKSDQNFCKVVSFTVAEKETVHVWTKRFNGGRCTQQWPPMQVRWALATEQLNVTRTKGADGRQVVKIALKNGFSSSHKLYIKVGKETYEISGGAPTRLPGKSTGTTPLPGKGKRSGAGSASTGKPGMSKEKRSDGPKRTVLKPPLPRQPLTKPTPVVPPQKETVPGGTPKPPAKAPAGSSTPVKPVLRRPPAIGAPPTERASRFGQVHSFLMSASNPLVRDYSMLLKIARNPNWHSVDFDPAQRMVRFTSKEKLPIRLCIRSSSFGNFEYRFEGTIRDRTKQLTFAGDEWAWRKLSPGSLQSSSFCLLDKQSKTGRSYFYSLKDLRSGRLSPALKDVLSALESYTDFFNALK